ncbi:MAG TPA: hypothetical protein VK838_04065, partial [Candidatus Limnocylindrales bacterium]|nr:hypothetical protein [Candidatus Limnocylindrales bacterium]
ANVARAASRSGFPFRVTTNDPIAAHLEQVVLADAHLRTATGERSERSTDDCLGEGRPLAADAALADAGSPAASVVAGGLAEEAIGMLVGVSEGSAWTSFGTGSPSQASSLLLTGEGTLVGPELFEATSDLRPGAERTGVLGVNRLLLAAVVVILIGSGVALVAGVDLAATLAGR